MRKHDIESSPISATETSEKIIPSGISHSFDISIAAHCGVVAAVIYSHLCYWITKNIVKGINFHEGRTWTYDTKKEIASNFSYLTYEQVKYALEILVEKGLIITGHFHDNKFKRELWYAIPDESILNVKGNEKKIIDKGNFPIAVEKPPQCIYKETDTIHTDIEQEGVASAQPSSAPVSVSKKLINRALHVETTEEEHGKLVKLRGESFVQHCYTTLSIWKVRTPRSKWKKGDYLSILKWVINAVDDEAKKGKGTSVDTSGDNKSPEEKNKEFAQKAADHCNPGIGKKKGVTIEIFSNYVIVKRLGSKSWEPINFRDANFKKRFTHELMKYELMERKAENE